MDQEAVSRPKLILPLLGPEGPEAGFNEVQQVVIVDFGTGLMQRQGLALAGKKHM
ncbi:hypothetical protein D3C75_1175020 [compost metagenome]